MKKKMKIFSIETQIAMSGAHCASVYDTEHYLHGNHKTHFIKQNI